MTPWPRAARGRWSWSSRWTTEDLDRVHDPLMSPLVWDLGHIAAFEDLWLGQRAGGLEPLRPDLAEVYDASETPRAERGDIPYLRRDDAIAYMDAVRERSLAVLDRADLSADSRPPERQRVRVGDADPPRAPAQRDDAADPAAGAPGHVRAQPRAPRPTAGEHHAGTVHIPEGEFEMGAAARGLRLRQRAPAPPRAPARLRHRPRAGDQRLLRRVRGRRRLRRARAVERRGLALAGGRERGPAAVLDRRRRRAPLRPGGADRSQPARDARVLVRGRRVRALGRRPAAHRGRVGAGRGLGPGHRRAAAVPVGPRAARVRARQPGPDRVRARCPWARWRAPAPRASAA